MPTRALTPCLGYCVHRIQPDGADSRPFWVGVLGFGHPEVVGLALFFRRYDAEQRVAQGATGMVQHPLDLVCDQCGAAGKPGAGKGAYTR